MKDTIHNFVVDNSVTKEINNTEIIININIDENTIISGQYIEEILTNIEGFEKIILHSLNERNKVGKIDDVKINIQ